MAEQIPMFDEDFARETFPTAFLKPDPEAPHVKRVQIEAFKGIEKLSINLPRIAVLTGPNNSGKSTVLQAINVGFECFRLCLDTDGWSFLPRGRAVKEIELLPVNEPRDMWFQRRTRRGRREWVPIVISLLFTNDFECSFAIRGLYGFLNVRVRDWTKGAGAKTFEQIASTLPVLIPAVSGLDPHEPPFAAARIHYLAGMGRPWAVLRNILREIRGEESDREGERRMAFLKEAIRQHFGVELQALQFDPRYDLEIRAPYREGEYDLDIVSAGSGMSQILQLLSLVVWRGSRILLIDEPDAHLHTSLQASLYDFLGELSEHFNLQIIMATHSRDLISRAPIEAIIPVDLTKPELSPIGSIDHLLLEYRRHGAVSNVDLALLYQSKRCLFVEGPTDARYLPLLAARLGFECFVGRNQVVPLEFLGGDKFTMVGDLAALFERMIGEPITWMVIRDRHYSIPEVLHVHEAQAEDKGIKNYHIWDRFSIENYLLEPALLHGAVLKKLTDAEREGVQPELIEELLLKASEQVADQAQTAYVTQTQSAYVRYQITPDRPWDHGADAALRFWREQIGDLPGYLHYLPGAVLFGKFVELLQETIGVNIRPEDVINVMDPESAPEEIIQVLEQIASL